MPTITTHGEHGDRPQCWRDQRRVDEHAHRDEEDRGEHVAHRLTSCSIVLALARLGDQRAGDERAERHRVAERLRQQRDGEADADAGDQRRLGAVERARRRASSAARRAARRRAAPTRNADEPAGGHRQARAPTGPRRATIAVSAAISRIAIEVLDDEHAEHELAQRAP